jgi:hypothetical protein
MVTWGPCQSPRLLPSQTRYRARHSNHVAMVLCEVVSRLSLVLANVRTLVRTAESGDGRTPVLVTQTHSLDTVRDGPVRDEDAWAT